MSLKLVSVEDYVAIINLMGAYQHLVDDGEEDKWVELFTEDGAFYGLPEAVGPPESFRGREGLKQIPRFAKQVFNGKYRHHMGSFFVEYGDNTDEAFARYYILASSWMVEQGGKMEMFALVKTHLVRVSGEWKIKSNTMTPL